MIKRTRTIVFIVCVVLFALIAPSVILYSQGYRFDFETKRIVQTGAFYFRVLPENARIYLNEKPKGGTSFFTNSILIENLLPKMYGVVIKKDGYHLWKKELKIYEKQVTEAKNIILIPFLKESDFIVLSRVQAEIDDILSEIRIKEKREKEVPEPLLESGFKDFNFSPDEKQIVYFNDYEVWILRLGQRSNQFYKEDQDKMFLARFSKKIGNVFWLTNHYLIFNVGDKIKIAEIDNRDKINIVSLSKFKNPEIFWDQKDKKLYVLSEEKLYLLENLLP